MHLKALSGKTLAVDTSIYMYKFAGDNALIENMYLLISIFKKYNIDPIFIFDGKPPPEKKTLLAQRRIEKMDAQKRYFEMKTILDNEDLNESRKQEVLMDMEQLKKQFIRIKDTDNRKVKDLMDAYGVAYYEADGEADALCCYLVKTSRAWACVSDDMDMFLYGCNRVIRHLSVLNHTAVFYDSKSILADLKMNETVFRDILLLSGTDYNTNSETNLNETIKWYHEYNKHCATNDNNLSFYDWLIKYTKYIKDPDELEKIKILFCLDNREDLLDKVKTISLDGRIVDLNAMKIILKEEGFVFV
jgi:5'-3' exonuclease